MYFLKLYPKNKTPSKQNPQPDLNSFQDVVCTTYLHLQNDATSSVCRITPLKWRQLIFFLPMRPYALLTYSINLLQFQNALLPWLWSAESPSPISKDAFSVHYPSFIYTVFHLPFYHPYTLPLYTFSLSWLSFPPKWNFIIHLLSIQITKAAVTQVLG